MIFSSGLFWLGLGEKPNPRAETEASHISRSLHPEGALAGAPLAMSLALLEFHTPQRKQLLLLSLSKRGILPVKTPALPAFLGIPEMGRGQ